VRISLIGTNAHSGTAPKKSYDPTGIWWLSTLVASLPLSRCWRDAVFRLKAHVAAVTDSHRANHRDHCVSHAGAPGFDHDPSMATVYGLFPICWIHFFCGHLLYQLTVKNGASPAAVTLPMRVY